MPLNRHSKIKEVWRHPVGHEMLSAMLRQQGRSEKWVERPLVAGMPLHRLDRTAGQGFTDMLLEMAENMPEHVASIPQARPAWWKEAVVYRVYLPSFMDADQDGWGDLAGAEQRLPYLESLGVDTIWLAAMVSADGQGGILDYRALQPYAGTFSDLDEFLQQAHGRGFRVVMGLDVSSTGEEHPWFQKALKDGGDDFYIFQPGSPTTPPNNWARSGQGPVWTWYPEAGAWGLNVQGKHKMDLNWDTPALRAEMANVLRFWRDKGLDGFVLGPVNMLGKNNFDNGGPAAAMLTGLVGYEKIAYSARLHRYLRELRGAVGDDVLLVGETKGIGAEMAKLFTGDRKELDMILDPVHLAAKPRGRDGEMRLDLAEMKDYYLWWMEEYGGERWMSLFLETPTTARAISRFGANPLFRAVLAKLLCAMLLTLRGTPIIYQGQELGLVNMRQPQNGTGAASGAQATPSGPAEDACHARVPMPWRSGAGCGFSGSQPWTPVHDGVDYLNAGIQMEDQASVWCFYQRLIDLRKHADCLVYGSFNPVFANNKRVFCYFRILDGEKWYVEMNLTEKEVSRPGRILRSQRLELSNYDNPAKSLRPYEVNLYRCE